MAEARVLVVDDDPEVVRLLEQDLAASGFTVFPACSGAAGLRVLHDTPVDAVVTDLRMPDVDGLEIVRAAAESQPDTKVIIITAFATIASAIHAVKQGAYDYVSKPSRSRSSSWRWSGPWRTAACGGRIARSGARWRDATGSRA